VPPELRRYLPLILILVFGLFLLPTLLHRHSSGISSKDRANLTVDAASRVDRAERAYQSTSGKYTSSVADLVAQDPKIANALAVGVVVNLDAGANGDSYVAQIAGPEMELVRARNGAKLIANQCLKLKSSGVTCPTTTTKPTKITTTTTATTTTTK
jgi:hypothetical protein